MPRVFTSEYKLRLRLVATAVTMASGAVPFILGLLVLQWLPEEKGWVPALIAGVSFAAGGLLPWAAQNLMGLVGNGSLRRRVLTNLKAADAPADLEGAIFVGFSPGERLHLWHGETSLDVGFLQLRRGGLVYQGDGYHWTLPRSFIDHIDLAPPEGGMQRLLVRWHVPREGGRTFSLEAREALTLARARLATQLLYRRLREWQRNGSPETAEADLPISNGLPPTDLSGAQVIDEPARGSCLTILAAMVITLLTIWRIAGTLLAAGMLYQAILWAGLLSVVGALATGHLLHYLQTWEAEHRGESRP